jgi:hypothetical protein
MHMNKPGEENWTAGRREGREGGGRKERKENVGDGDCRRRRRSEKGREEG